MTRNLVSDYGMEPSRAEALRTIMEEAFPEATAEGWEEMEPEMRNDPKDRHVVAAAVAVEATIIVTSNIRDFGNLPEGIIALTPDEFLSKIFARHPKEVLEALTIQGAAYRRPELTAGDQPDKVRLKFFRSEGWLRPSCFQPAETERHCGASSYPHNTFMRS
ncbi:hypothetical protein [Sinorhizobium fredii]|uniref:VapC50 C-terminal domain-containing protein n=1 Tax=Rhizobium fredii TaxID=380 RepID=A0A2L0H9T7_RHIFR|nr:hypothetical protein [Sinorhizobium fredii]AUX77932.1 hypothetical protein NXT3_CH03397 [Sinorhizobium fredii]